MGGDAAGSPPIVVVMGVTGVGKSTIGPLIADALHVPFVDADDFHDPTAIEKMRAGIPLDDDDRGPWLRRLNAVLREHAVGVVLAASALTEPSRAALTEGVDGVRYALLTTDPKVIADRIAGRVDHFAGAALLPSQLALLDPPDGAIVLDASINPHTLVERALAALSPVAPRPRSQADPGTRTNDRARPR